MLFNVTGSGGNPINFRVVGGTTQPTSPKENTIWVKTAIDIPYWTTASSAKAPAYVAQKGTVTFWWASATSAEVSSTTSTGFMPIKYKATNPPGYMRLKPINCYQNQDGTAAGWKSMDAYIYKGGEWVDVFEPEILFYSNGVFDTSYVHTEMKTPSSATIVYGDNEITLSTVGRSTSEVYTVIGPVNLTRLSSLTLTGTFKKETSASFTNVAVLFVAGTAETSYKSATAIASVIKNSTAPAGYEYTAELDVSSLTGEYYIYAGVNTQNAAWDNPRINTITLLKGESEV